MVHTVEKHTHGLCAGGYSLKPDLARRDCWPLLNHAIPVAFSRRSAAV